MPKEEIKIPEVGMDAVFYPCLSTTMEKNEPRKATRGRVIFVNNRTRIFTIERKVTLGVLRESFRFFDIGQRVTLYRNR